MAHFIIISYFFCSEGVIGSKRWREMASLIRDHGKVTVICADGSRVADERIRVICVHDLINGTRSSNGFAEKPPNNRFAREVRHVVQSLLFWPDRQKWWARRAVARIAGLISESGRTYVITSGPRFSVHSEMCRWIRTHPNRIRWIMDLRDPWTNDPSPAMRRRTPRFLTRIEATIEARCHQKANLVTTVSDVMTKMMKRDFRSRAVTIYNGYPKSLLPAYSEFDDHLKEPGVISIRYLGSIIHGLRTPSLLFHAARELGNEADFLRFEFWCNDASEIRFEASRHSVEHLVHCHQAVSLNQSHRLQRTAASNLILNGTDDNSNHMITGKAFELIAAQRPVIAITGKNSELRLILENCKCNGIVWDLETALSALRRLLSDSLNRVSDSDFLFSRETAVSILLREINSLRRPSTTY